MTEPRTSVALVAEQPRLDGVQRLYRFDNDYGASVVLSSDSYGIELGVIHWKGDEAFNLVYNTPVTSDVIGWLEPGDLDGILERIEALPVRDPEHIARELAGETVRDDDE